MLLKFITSKFKKTSSSHSIKRQWGTEKNTSPLSNLHEKPSSKEIAFSRASIVLTILFWLIYVSSVIFRQFVDGENTYDFTVEALGYLIVVTFLTFSALMYLVARQGALQRFLKHKRTPRAVIDRHFSKHQPSITVLIPSYSEEPEVVRKTILSAALQEYPNIRVVLLIDDNPNIQDEDKLKKLNKTRNLPERINRFLNRPRRRATRAYNEFLLQSEKSKTISPKYIAVVAEEYKWAAGWLKRAIQRESIDDHVDVFFTEQVYGELAKDLELVAQALETSVEQGAKLTKDRVDQLYRRLVWIFSAKIQTFERKQFASLSHEPNKAMNLNAYIGLMGGKYRMDPTPDGPVLVKVSKYAKGDLVVPDSDFILTLDADSVLLRDYCLRLVYFLQQPDNLDVAVTQTPYSSFRGASTRIERLSGATTDIQHILHQGMSYYNATFWVGANAVIRKKALEDIKETEWVGGFEVNRYIQDSTVIEDTESSIDLALHGWRLINYPERLSYSATPPDFGSLVVQRRRWANGGLLIMPKLWANIRRRKSELKHVSTTEIMLRLNYMASIAWSNFGLVFLLAYPYDGRLLSPYVLLAALPYFIAMARDLKYCRYNYTDIIRIYGFNLILLPVNLAGVFKSVQQALTTKKIPFARTPKVKNRTAVASIYLLAPLLIVGFSLLTLWRNIEGENWGNALFAGFNAFAASWAIVSYIGVFNLIEDLWLGVKEWLYVDVDTAGNEKPDDNAQRLNWQSVLYHGEEHSVTPHTSLSNIIIKQGKKLDGKGIS